MKYLITPFILLLFCGFAQSQVHDSLKVISLKPRAFRDSLQKTEKVLLADVREFFEYKKSRIGDAVNMPSSCNIDQAADTLSKNYSYFLYCTSGFRSKRVARRLLDKGFIHVYSLEGGLNEWKKQGLAVNRKKIRK
jgi:rhodanese-related sulfurtransferase